MNDKHMGYGLLGSFVTWLSGWLDLNTFCMLMGLMFGMVTLLVTWYYKRKNSIVFAAAAAKAAERGYVLNGPKE